MEAVQVQVNEETTEILRRYNVKDSWKDVFDTRYFTKVINTIPELCTPDKDKILLALSKCSPQDVKVVIVGHDPITDKNLATGFAFSFPQGEIIDNNVTAERTFQQIEKGHSVRILHNALVAGGYLRSGGTYDCCHEEWAEKGVLLLNASLTADHFYLWKSYMRRFLYAMAHLQYHQQISPVYFLFWGTNAEYVGTELYGLLIGTNIPCTKITYNSDTQEEIKEGIQGARIVVYIGHHPTFPRNEANYFIQQAGGQFRTIKETYGDLFTLQEVATGNECVDQLSKQPIGI